jgi:hypothetical protein
MKGGVFPDFFPTGEFCYAKLQNNPASRIVIPPPYGSACDAVSAYPPVWVVYR